MGVPSLHTGPIKDIIYIGNIMKRRSLLPYATDTEVPIWLMSSAYQ